MVSVALTQKQWLRSDHGSYGRGGVAAASVRGDSSSPGLELHPEGRVQGPGMLGPLGWRVVSSLRSLLTPRGCALNARSSWGWRASGDLRVGEGAGGTLRTSRVREGRRREELRTRPSGRKDRMESLSQGGGCESAQGAGWASRSWGITCTSEGLYLLQLDLT